MDIKELHQPLQLDLEQLAPRNNLSYLLDFKLAPCREVSPLLTYRSAYGSYGIFADPVGSAQIMVPKPFHWWAIHGFNDFPGNAFTIELSICPFRCNSRTTLVSYSTGIFGTRNDLLICVSDKEGILVEINGKTIATQCFPDYSQWQDLAISWESATGTVAIHNDDRDEAILSMLQKEAMPPTVNCLFKGKLAQGESIRGGGTLVVGQQQTVAGNMQLLVPDAGMTGSVKRIRVWEHVRTTDQLGEDKAVHITEKTPGLIGDWGISAASLSQHESLNFAGEYSAHLLAGNSQLNDPSAFRLGVFNGRRRYYSTRHFLFNRSSELRFELAGRKQSLWMNGSAIELKQDLSSSDPETLATGLSVSGTVKNWNVNQINRP